MPIQSKWILFAAVALGSGATVPACGDSESPSSSQVGAGGSAAMGSGGSTTGSGGSTTGGGGSAGGAGVPLTGSGGSTAQDASVDLSFCFGDGGKLVASARACTMDSDCGIIVSRHCCGAANAIGILKSEQTKFASCFGLAPNACQGLGCATILGYMTDTGETVEYASFQTNVIDVVSVHCTAKVCTTDVPPPDAGRD